MEAFRCAQDVTPAFPCQPSLTFNHQSNAHVLISTFGRVSSPRKPTSSRNTGVRVWGQPPFKRLVATPAALSIIELLLFGLPNRLCDEDRDHAIGFLLVILVRGVSRHREIPEPVSFG